MSDNTVLLNVTARDPIICRDGRPFNSGDRIKSLDWIYPSVFAGSLRTLLGKQLGWIFNEEEIEALKGLKIRGPLPCFKGEIYFPKPLDCVVKEDDDDKTSKTEKTYSVFAARPAELLDGEGTDLPTGLRPVLLPDSVTEDFKPVKTNPFWSMAKMLDWLVQPTGSEFAEGKYNKTAEEEPRTLAAPKSDERTHVAIQAGFGTAKNTMLFSTSALDMMAEKCGDAMISFAAEVGATGELAGELAEALKGLQTLHPLGGERRLAQWQTDKENTSLMQAPEALKQHSSEKKIRMVLATPAIFSGGWRPGWIDERTLQGTIPGSNVLVKLVGAVVDRWKPISGWSYETGKHGPKASRRLVPAGSVYFLKIIEGDFGTILDSCWLQSVCDDPQDRNDGFGIIVWGVGQ